ncbi:RNA 2',3'-cyclic phosphodiesterase [Brevibacillus ruminantium]|uniref:RNA 2',3'-cyclic phosphodiesterase n=1 Tax=Brevibacillus ruminantium TaxID=2950604 RepID=A0ABY4WPI5_9BACL|nr:RNA 2',3'-cyclic phosphodiesterase [Brevibacillus ruminantium]USG67309.1 RNA 2',3'-cyclic phosphodiesterase [Brevibacillus ruminantium]
MRLFVALEIPEVAAQYIEQVQKQVRGEIRAERWQSLHNLHLTLHFLGEVEEKLVPDISRDMDIVSEIIPPFTLKVGGFGAFPTWERPRVLWLGLRGQIEPLKQLHLLLGKRFDLHPGLSYDQKLYRPHITLARGPKTGPQGVPAAEWNERFLSSEPPEWQVTRFHLFRSELRPEGAKHSILYTSTFGKDHGK